MRVPSAPTGWPASILKGVIDVPKTGLFVAWEGNGGLGKTTNRDLVAERLRADGYDIVTTREPGDSDVGAKIRSLLLDPAYDMTPLTDALLFAADRSHHVSNVIVPALEGGAIVLCDRYVDSTRAYQGAGGGDLAMIEQLITLAAQGVYPARTYLFDAPPELGLSRIGAAKRTEPDKFDQQRQDFLVRVREGFLRQAATDPPRYRVIDADAGREELADTVYHDLLALL